MFCLSTEEIEEWRALAVVALRAGGFDPSILEDLSPAMRPAVCYYLGTALLAGGRVTEARRWLECGAGIEPLRASSYLLDYLERNEGELRPVQPGFSDPRPWAYFSSLPHLRSAREALIGFCERSLPVSERPLRVMDIGCGNGQLSVAVIKRLIDSGKATDVADLMLLDPSARMLEAAGSNASAAFPGTKITTSEGKLEESSSVLPGGFDLALCALSVHHMPYEQKEVHIGALCQAVRNVIIFELGANHDTPEMGSPELAYSVYQTSGQSLEYIFEQDAPIEVQRACADIFVMSETISLLSEPRGKRTEYHMKRKQWHELLETIGSPEMTCLGEMTCFSDEYCELFALHYGC
jgi:SAM-dependent methyltransferase